jgi:hypothetical protein
MIEILEKIDNKLVDRFHTIHKNIESKSNSFYESLLALLEGFAKHIVKKENIIVDSDYDTFIGILRVEKFKDFLAAIKLPNSIVEDLFRISKSINLHKHDEQAEIEIDIVLEYLKTSFVFFKFYHDFKFGPSDYVFDPRSIHLLYGKTERELKILQKDKMKLEESLLQENSKSALLESDLKRVLEIQANKDEKLTSLESQKEQFLNQINELKDIKLTSMEDKVGRILTALNKQTEALNKVTNQLLFSAHLQEKTINATKSLNNVVTNSSGSGYSEYKVNFSEYERFFLTENYRNQALDLAWEKLGEIKEVLPINSHNNSAYTKKIIVTNTLGTISLVYKEDKQVIENSFDKKKFSIIFRSFQYNSDWSKLLVTTHISQMRHFLISITMSCISNGILLPNPKDSLLEEFYLNGENLRLLFLK